VKAMIYRQYGGPEVLELAEVPDVPAQGCDHGAAGIAKWGEGARKDRAGSRLTALGRAGVPDDIGPYFLNAGILDLRP
jgi:hypothetical protein